MAKAWEYKNAESSISGTMQCTACGKRITEGEYRCRQESKGGDWGYVAQHRACTQDDPQWVLMDAAQQKGKTAAVNDLAARLVDELDGLVSESDGVSGLHLNGDVATWEELLPGGRFERLSSLDELRAALANVEHHTATLQAEIEALRAERDAAFRMSRCECASDECCANLVKHQQRAERLAEAINAYKSEYDNPAKDYVLRAKRRDEMFALLREQEEGK